MLFYTHKMMTEKLKNIDWENVEIIKESPNGLCVYRFPKAGSGGSMYVAFVNGPLDGNSATTVIPLSDLGIKTPIRLTEAVPRKVAGARDKTGQEFKELFDSRVISGQITLGEAPVYLEAKDLSSLVPGKDPGKAPPASE